VALRYKADRVAGWTPAYGALLRAAAERTLSAEGFAGDGQVFIGIVSRRRIRRLNLEHRGIDAETDVLSFPQYERAEVRRLRETPGLVLGDIVIAADIARKQATEYGHSPEREIGFLAVHGILHLLGHDHDDPEKERAMRDAQEKIMAELGLGRDKGGAR